MDLFLIIFGIVLAYLIGSIPSSVWIGRVFYGVDIRTQGSGNAGTTNMMRILGWKPGVVVLLIDAFKGFLAVFLSRFFVPENFSEDLSALYAVVAAIAALLGHIFPVYVGFKGGKGVATMVGVLLALYPGAFLACLVIFVVTMIWFRYVSLSSVITALCFPFIVIFVFHTTQISLIVFSILVAVFIPLTHKKNIKRLLDGTEAKFTINKK